MIILTREELLKMVDIDIYNEITDYNTDVQTAADITLERFSNILYKEVRKQSLTGIPDDDKLSDLQIATIKDVLANLVLYYKGFGDIKAQGGMEVTGKPVVPDDYIDDLRRCGLIRKSIGRKSIW